MGQKSFYVSRQFSHNGKEYKSGDTVDKEAITGLEAMLMSSGFITTSKKEIKTTNDFVELQEESVSKDDIESIIPPKIPVAGDFEGELKIQEETDQILTEEGVEVLTADVNEAEGELVVPEENLVEENEEVESAEAVETQEVVTAPASSRASRLGRLKK